MAAVNSGANQASNPSCLGYFLGEWSSSIKGWSDLAYFCMVSSEVLAHNQSSRKQLLEFRRGVKGVRHLGSVSANKHVNTDPLLRGLTVCFSLFAHSFRLQCHCPWSGYAKR